MESRTAFAAALMLGLSEMISILTWMNIGASTSQPDHYALIRFSELYLLTDHNLQLGLTDAGGMLTEIRPSLASTVSAAGFTHPGRSNELWACPRMLLMRRPKREKRFERPLRAILVCPLAWSIPGCTTVSVMTLPFHRRGPVQAPKACHFAIAIVVNIRRAAIKRRACLHH